MFPQAADLADVLGQHPRQRRRDHRGPGRPLGPGSSTSTDPNGAGERHVSKWGGFLPEIPFDPLRYGIPPAALAVDRAGAAARAGGRARAPCRRRLRATRPFDRERTVGHLRRRGGQRPVAHALRLPRRAAALPRRAAGRAGRAAARADRGLLPRHARSTSSPGRIANRLDLGGANYTVDAACASSLAAVDVGVHGAARPARSDLVLAAAPTCTTASTTTCCFCIGAGAVADAAAADLRRGGRRHRHSARASPAWCSSGWPTPSATATGSTRSSRASAPCQRRPGHGPDRPAARGPAPCAGRGPTRRPGSRPAEVGLVEAHGTGTVVGDRTELDHAHRASSPRPARSRGSCALGSVKSQIGHTKCTAGLAGLIKAALALHHRRAAAAPAASTHAEPGLGRRRPARSSSHRGAALAAPADAARRRRQRLRLRRHQLPRRARRRTPTRRRRGTACDHWPAELFLFAGASTRKSRASPSSTPRDLGRGDGRAPRPCAPARRRRPRERAGPAGHPWSRPTWTTWPRPARRALAGDRRSGRRDSCRPQATTPPRRGRLPVPRPGQPAARDARPTCSSPSRACSDLRAAARQSGPALFPAAAFDAAGDAPSARAHRHPSRPARARHRRAGDVPHCCAAWCSRPR